MSIGGIVVAALTLLSLLLFLLTYRARAILWLDSAARASGPGRGAREAAGDGARASAGLDETEIQRRTLASQGFYVIEVFSLAAACYLLTVCLRAFGVTGSELWILSLTVCAFVPLILAPGLLRWAQRGLRRSARGTGDAGAAPQDASASDAGASGVVGATFFSESILKSAERTYAMLRGEVSRGKMTAESAHWKNVLELLLRLRDRRVSEVMVSRVDMVCAEETSTVSEVAELVKEVAYTRIPVFSRTLDTITGYVTAKDVVIQLHQGGGSDPVSSIARKPVHVPSDDAIEHALREMQKARVTLAIVTDPSGSTAGLVTGEDILEEVVGDFYAYYEPEEPAYQVIDDKTAVVRANVALADLREILGAVPSLPPADLKLTLGEYVRLRLRAEPSRGESVSDDIFSYSVARTVGKEIWSLRVERKK